MECLAISIVLENRPEGLKPLGLSGLDGYRVSRTKEIWTRFLDRNVSPKKRAKRLFVSVWKTVGYCWRNHNKAAKAACTWHYGWQGRTRILFLSELTPRCEQIFPHRCCFQPVRR